MLFNQGAVGAERVFEIIDKEPNIKEISSAPTLNAKQCKIEYKNVNFSYERKKEILKSLNLTIEGGNVIALVGHSGAGKTTTMNLIPRFYNASSGDILIDNQSTGTHDSLLQNSILLLLNKFHYFVEELNQLQKLLKEVFFQQTYCRYAKNLCVIHIHK